MDRRLDIIKGIHPGKLIERDLVRKHLTQRYLAHETGIPYQTINAIIAGKRNLTTGQAMKIGSLLSYEESFLSILQTHYEIKQHKEKALAELYDKSPRIRKSLFWDADFDKINWAKYKKVVIQRVAERGSKDEINEITRFYNLTTNEMELFKPEEIIRNRLIQRIKI